MTDERRRTPRTPHDDQVIVRVLSTDPKQLAPGTTLYARSADVSVSGLRVMSETAVISGTKVEIWVIATHRLGTLLLSGQIVWSTPADGADYFWLGIDLDLRKSTDAADWKLMVRDLESRHRARDSETA